MATIKKNASSKPEWASALWLALIVMLGSWGLPFIDRWMTPEVVAFGSLIISIVMRNYTETPLSDK